MAEKKAASKPKKAAPKKKTPAKKAPAKKPEPKPVPTFAGVTAIHVDSDGRIVLGFDGKDYALDKQTLLNLRREINDVAAGLVH